MYVTKVKIVGDVVLLHVLHQGLLAHGLELSHLVLVGEVEEGLQGLLIVEAVLTRVDKVEELETRLLVYIRHRYVLSALFTKVCQLIDAYTTRILADAARVYFFILIIGDNIRLRHDGGLPNVLGLVVRHVVTLGGDGGLALAVSRD